MVAYRFCRPDDIPLLVRAVNECWRPHSAVAPEPAPALTEEAFRREMKQLDVWPSNSMLALDGAGEPLAVSIGTKRPDEVLVHRVAVRPGHQRQGHGRHLLTSLSQKLAVLGPERLVAEVPAANAAAVAFFEALGWTREDELSDRVRAAPAGPPERPVPDGLIVPVTVGELEAAGVLEVSPRAPWQRSLPTLRQRADELVGIAVATPGRGGGVPAQRAGRGGRGGRRRTAAGDPRRRLPRRHARRLPARPPLPLALPHLASRAVHPADGTRGAAVRGAGGGRLRAAPGPPAVRCPGAAVVTGDDDTEVGTKR